MSGSAKVVSVDPWLLAKLVCPVTRRPLRHDDVRNELISDAAGLAFPIRDGVPVMLVAAARALDTAERSTEPMR